MSVSVSVQLPVQSQKAHLLCKPLAFGGESCFWCCLYFHSISFVRLLACGKCGIPFSTNVQVIRIWAFERVEPMNLFTVYATMATVAVAVTTATAIAVLLLLNGDDDDLCACVFVFVFVCASIKPKPNGLSTLFGFWLKLWTIATVSLLWSLPQSGCWKLIERRFFNVSFALNTVEQFAHNNIAAAPEQIEFIACINYDYFISLNFLDVTTITVLCYRLLCMCILCTHCRRLGLLHSIHWKHFTIQLKLQRDDIWY